MNTIKLTLIAALVGVASSAAMAQDDSDQSRRERMDSAYSDYQASHPNGSSSSTVDRGENSVKRGLHRTGQAIKHGAEKVGHAIGNGVRKTGQAIDHGGEKLENASSPKQ